MRAIAAAMVTMTLAGCSAFGIRSGTEEPAYTLLGISSGVEIRQYAPRIAMETLVDGEREAVSSEAFRRLAGYIFGGNTTQTSIAMTAPVAQTSQTLAMTAPVAQEPAGSGRWRMRFFAPSSMTLEGMPTPNDPRVAITPVPAEIFAVRRFTGSRSVAAVADEEKLLRDALASLPWRPAGDLAIWFYDPPWTLPFLRRNEVALPVTPRG